MDIKASVKHVAHAQTPPGKHHAALETLAKQPIVTARMAVVVSAEWHLGYGKRFDETSLKTLPQGSVYWEARAQIFRAAWRYASDRQGPGLWADGQCDILIPRTIPNRNRRSDMGGVLQDEIEAGLQNWRRASGDCIVQDGKRGR
jgi:hypothetical protein